MASITRLSEANLPIAFGGASVSGEGGGYSFGNISEDNAVSLIRYSYDRGIQIYDSAPVYGFGLSEKRIGKAVKPFRENTYLISKSGVTWHDSMRINMTNDPIVTQKMLNQSLRDFDTDYIDLYFIHWPDAKIDIRRPMEVLAKAKLEGKIRSIGLCNTYVDDLERAREIDEINVVQGEFNFFARHSLELFPYLAEHDIEFMNYGTFDKGVLTGRVSKEREENKDYDTTDCRKWAPWWKRQDRSERYQAVKKIQEHLLDKGHNLVEFALSFNLSFNEINTLICGFRSFDQLDSILSSLENLPQKELLEECESFHVS